MVGIIQAANRIFYSTAWKVPGDHWGFVIKQVLVHTAYSTGEKNGRYSYNYRKDKWTIDDKLNSFSQDEDIPNFCLAHLFTADSFDDGVLGYAFVGSTSGRGGACSRTMVDFDLFHHGILRYYPRTGWTSAMVSNQYLPRLQHQLVTAHEIGHSWGASHDDGDVCSPNDQYGGHYIMYMYSVRGNQPNNFRFSKCSIDDISRFLEEISSDCFSPRSEYVLTCGNWVLDEREQCDSGAYSLEGSDPCCTNTCTLKKNANCSDYSTPCCLDCQLAPAGTICHPNLDLQCQQAARCDGIHFECPKAPNAKDGTKCVDGGTCFNGSCVPYCETLGKKKNLTYKTCMCEHSATAACMRCCMEVYNNSNGPCFETDQRLGNKRQCFNGFCNEEGVCIPTEGNFMRKLSDFFNNLQFDSLAELMKTNLIMIVIALSAIIWIPTSLYISRKDKRLLQQIRDEDIAIMQLMELWEQEEMSMRSNDSPKPRTKNTENQLREKEGVKSDAHTARSISLRHKLLGLKRSPYGPSNITPTVIRPTLPSSLHRRLTSHFRSNFAMNNFFSVVFDTGESLQQSYEYNIQLF
ncbi:ADAM 17-like protease [Pomacea canaliculata]|uniref:ADAM 17-like protease n=1 Tax=Pomacea canaliculata TaxID=400727 RepID=UPI000D72FFC4|nr:ADAM 17-like protease [Pomacea canaliculata]